MLADASVALAGLATIELRIVRATSRASRANRRPVAHHAGQPLEFRHVVTRTGECLGRADWGLTSRSFNHHNPHKLPSYNGAKARGHVLVKC